MDRAALLVACIFVLAAVGMLLLLYGANRWRH